MGWKAGGRRFGAGIGAGVGAEGVKDPPCKIYAWNRASSSGLRLNAMMMVLVRIIIDGKEWWGKRATVGNR